MDVQARTRFVRLSPSKARDLARRIQGRPVSEALDVTGHCDRKSARLLGKTLKSAIANAENNAKLDVNGLIVKRAVVDEGPRMKRFWARARGGVRPIRKRMAHLTVVLTDGTESREPQE